MVARKKAAPRARRSAAPRARKTKRRVNTLNRSVKKPMQAAGVLVGAMIPYGGSMIEAVKTKSIGPVSSAIMSKDNAVQAAKNAAVGFIAGTAVGLVADKTGLKKPINRVKRTLRGLTGGLL